MYWVWFSGCTQWGQRVLDCGQLIVLWLQVVFLGPLSLHETTKLADRLLKFIMIKVVFVGE